MLADWFGLNVHRMLSLRYLSRHRTRTFLVVLSIALGVGTVVATRVLSATLVRAAEESVSPFSRASDLIVVNGQTGMSAKVAAEIRAANVAGVRSVQPVVFGRVTIPELGDLSVLVVGIDWLAADGENPAANDEWGILPKPEIETGAILLRLLGAKLSPPLGISPPAFVGRDLADDLARKSDSGDFTIEMAQQKTAVRRVGVVDVRKGSPAAALGTGFLVLHLPSASAVLNPEWPEYVSQINIDIATGADKAALKRRLQEIVGKRAEVRTMEENSESLRDVTAGLQLGFDLGGAGALVIGMFLVYNALSVSVAERRHDIGILRAVGATRRQIAGLFVGEALLLGLLGSGLGVPLGWGLARAAVGPIRGLLGPLLGQLGETPIVVTPGLAVAAVTAGVVVTKLASLMPALEAAAEEPADAVRRVPLVSGLLRRLVKVAVAGLLLLACFLCTYYRDRLPLRAGAFSGVVLLMLAALVVTPMLSGVVGRVLHPVFTRVFGLEGRLAADNLARSARRVGIVIAALMATTALLVQTSGFIVSSEHAILSWIDHKVSADLVVTGGSAIQDSGLQVPMDESLAAQIRAELPEAEAVLGARIHYLNFRDRLILMVAIDMDAFGRDDRRFLSRNLARYPQLRERRRVQPVLASDNFAALYRIKPGERFSVFGRDRNAEVELELVDTVEDYLWNRGIVIVDRAWFRDTFGDRKVDIYDVFLKEGASADAARDRLEQWGRKRALFVATRGEVLDEISSGLRRLYSLAYAQQVLVGLVALLGVISTLFISVLQRTRDFGLLRAIGATRMQIMRSVLAEATLMGVIGAILGLAAGWLLEWYVLDVLLLDEAGFLFPLRFPWIASGLVAAAAIVSATLVGLLPAWHATRLRIPEAIAYE
jgi:putative ABC transport system permease protein